jgi:hypothetical protein
MAARLPMPPIRSDSVSDLRFAARRSQIQGARATARLSGVDDLLSGPVRHCAGIFGERTSGRLSAVSGHLEIDEAEAYLQRPIDLTHGRRVESPETPHKPLAVH